MSTIPQSLQIDSNGSFVVVNNKYVFCSSLSLYMSQKLQIMLQKFMGEYYLDASDDGIPWFSLFGKGIGINTIDSKIKAEIMKANHVLNITSYSSSLNTATRTLTVTFSVQLTDNTNLRLALPITIGGF